MSDVMQFKDLLSRTGMPGVTQQPLQRQADPLSDKLIMPIQRPAQLKAVEPLAEPEPDAEKPVQQKKDPSIARLESGPSLEEAAPEPEVETEAVQAKLEIGGGGGPAPSDDPSGGKPPDDPIQAKNPGDSALPSGGGAPGGDAPADAPSAGGPAAPPAPSGGPASAAPPPSPAPAPGPAPAPAPAPAPSPSGSALPADVGAKMSKSLGSDFKDVVVREDSSASQIGAQAYTKGKEITFAPGKYDPHTKAGQQLIGHELKHVQQQSEGRVEATHQAKGGQAVNADPALEAEADAAGAKAAAGEPASGTSRSSGGAQAKRAGSVPVGDDTVVQAKGDGVIQLDGGEASGKVDYFAAAKKYGVDYKGFVTYVASTSGDQVATQKLKEVAAETNENAVKKVPEFYEKTAQAFLQLTDAKQSEANALYGVMQNIAWPWKGIGGPVPLGAANKELSRVEGIGKVYGMWVPDDDKQDILEAVAAEKGKTVAELPGAWTGSPTRSGKLDLTNLDDMVYAKWLLAVAAKPELDVAKLKGAVDANAWWTPDLKTRLESTKERGPDQDFGEIVDYLSLAPEWYPDGVVQISKTFPKTDWVRPTVFDGMMSPLWQQHAQGALPKAGGGAIEVLNTKKLPANQLTTALAKPVTEGLSAALRAEQDRQKNDGSNTNDWVYDKDQVGNGQVGKIQSKVQTGMGGSPDGGEHEASLWEPTSSPEKRFYWESNVVQFPQVGAFAIPAVVVVHGNVHPMQKKIKKEEQPIINAPSDAQVGALEDTWSAHFLNGYIAENQAKGFAVAQTFGQPWGDFNKNLGKMLDPQHIWANIFFDLIPAQDVEASRARFDKNRKDEGGDTSLTKKYWEKSGKKSPVETEEEPAEVTPEVATPDLPKKEPKHPEATSIPFVTQKIVVKNKKAPKPGNKKDIPLVVTGTVWMKHKGAEAAAEVPAEAATKVRRAVATTFPSLLENRVAELGLDDAIATVEVDKICKVAAITAGYDAERFDLEILEVHAEVLRDEAAESAFAAAEESGAIDEAETPGMEVGFEIDKKAGTMTGKVNFPLLQLGGGVVARNLNGSATYKVKTKQMVKYTGGATIIIPIGSSQVIEVTVADAVIEKDGDKYRVESGTGSFACKMPIKLFAAKGYEWYLAEGAKGTVTVKKGAIDDISGSIDLRVRNAEQVDQFHVVANTSFAIAKDGTVTKPLSGKVVAEVLEHQELAKGFGPDKTWAAFLSKGTKADANIDKGALTTINGTLKAHIVDADKTWLTLEATGDYDHAQRLTNIPTARISVVKTTLVGRVGEGREVHFVAGSSLDATMAKNEVTKAWGTLDFVLKVGGKEKIGGNVNGTWEPTQGLSGTGNLNLLDDFHGEVPGGFIKIYKGSSGSGVLEKGELQSIDAQGEADFKSLFRGKDLEVNLKGKAHFDWPKKKLVSAEATAILKKPLELTDNIGVTRLDGSMTIKNNELTSVKGALGVTVLNEKGILFEGDLSGSWESATNQVNGAASLALKQDLDLSFGSTLKGRLYQGENRLNAKMVAGQITTLSGQLRAGVLEGETEIATLTAKGTYDVKNNILVDLTASSKLSKSVKLLNDAITIDKANAEVTVKNNVITHAKGSAEVNAPKIKVEKATFDFTWRNDGVKDYWSFNGKVVWVFFEKDDRHLKGDLSLNYGEDGAFVATANIDYQMDKGFGAKGSLTIDNTMEPTINLLQFNFTTELAKQTELFKFDTTIIALPLRIPPVFRLSFGLDLGSSLMMRPITLGGKFQVQNWKPGATDDKQVPEFDANLDMKMGFDFEIWLKANIEAAIDVLVASAGIGADAKLTLKVPIGIEPSLALHGGPKGWSGAFSLDIDISPELLLELSTYLFADIVFFDPWTTELGQWDIPLGALPGIKWKDTFPFGEQKEAKPQPAKKEKPPVPAPPKPESKKKTVNKKADQIQDPVAKKGKPETKEATLPGGQKLGGGPLGEDPTKGQDKNKEGEKGTRTQLDDLMAAAKGLQSIDVFIKWMKKAAWYVITSGPFLGVLKMALDVATGALDWNELKEAWRNFEEGIGAAGRLLSGMSKNQFSFTARLGEWMQGKKTTWQLIMEGDDEVVKFINDGKHLDGKLDVNAFKAMFETLCGWDNVCGDEEETAVIKLMRQAKARGFLAEAVSGCSGTYSGADQVLWKLDGEQDGQAREIFASNNIMGSAVVLDAVAKKKYPGDFSALIVQMPYVNDKQTAMGMYDQDPIKAKAWAKTKIPK